MTFFFFFKPKSLTQRLLSGMFKFIRNIKTDSKKDDSIIITKTFEIDKFRKNIRSSFIYQQAKRIFTRR